MSNTREIEEIWTLLAGKRRDFVESFYSQLFQRFPDYQQYFPKHMDAQMELMMELVGSIARFSNHIDLIRPYLLQVGAAHKDMVLLKREDLCNFRDVFIDTAAIICGEHWEERHAKAFRDAFDDTIIPIIFEGMRS